MSSKDLLLALLVLCLQSRFIQALPTPQQGDIESDDTEPPAEDENEGVIDGTMINSMMKAEFSHHDSYSMSVDDLLKTLMFLTRTDTCKQDTIIAPPIITDVRHEFKHEQVTVRVQEEENVVNYFVVYQGLGNAFNFALRSGTKTNLPLRNVPRDTVILVEIFALRRCMWQVFWSSSVYLEVKVSQDDEVTIVTPPAATRCKVPRPSMALEGKLSEDSMTFSIKAEPMIDRYLVTMDTKTTRHQTYISNGPSGYGINGMTIGELSPASMYKVTIIGETKCFDKLFHGAPIFFSAKTIGTRVDPEDYPNVVSSDELILHTN